MGWFASRTKVDWSPEPFGLLTHARMVAGEAARLASDTEVGLRSLSAEATRTLLRDSISPLPLHKTLALLDAIDHHRDDHFYDHERLALAKTLQTKISNLRFGPEVGVGAIREDAPVFEAWLDEVHDIARDLCDVQPSNSAPACVYHGDAREPSAFLPPASVDAVITSPPYPNEKDYTRIMRLEMAVLGLINSPAELQQLKRTLLCSNTRTAYRNNTDDQFVSGNDAIERVADQIETRRCELGKTSGFERMYPRVVRLYFGGMHRHFADLRRVLRPGARLAYVVGDQASYLRVMIRTGQLLAEVAKSLGYEVIDIDLFRTRRATATGEDLREEALLLRWPG
jgi:hypothetical protein